MVKKIVIFFAYTLFFLSALMYFTPKSSIYFFLEKKLEQVDVVVSSEDIQDSGFTLHIKNADISFKSISSVDIKETNINIFAIYNSINFKDITLSSTARSFAPLKIENIKIVHSIFNPLNVKIHSVGEFGELDAEFNIVDNSIHLELKPSKVMSKNYKNTLKKLSKTENGEFVYDKTF